MDELKQTIDLDAFSDKMEKVRSEASKALVGQQALLDRLLTALFAGGHVLVEGVPGVAKTLSAKLLASMVDVAFKRIQFTPDLMPSDILGTAIFNPTNQNFEYRKGPIFGSIVLIDEINRAPAKTQSSLFEVMEELQITNDGHIYKMDEVFMVVGTQNPIEHEGTYRLPEAQLDRFLFKLNVGYPSVEEEVSILDLVHGNGDFKKLTFIDKVLDKAEIIGIRAFVNSLLIKPALLQYIAELIQKTREHTSLYLGASPRASIDLMNASRALAAINGRDFVTPEDIKSLFEPVVAHRVMLTPESELQGVTIDEVCRQIIQQVEVPK